MPLKTQTAQSIINMVMKHTGAKSALLIISDSELPCGDGERCDGEHEIFGCVANIEKDHLPHLLKEALRHIK